MSFSSILNTIDQYVKLPAWLTFVGYMLIVGGLIGIAVNAPKPVHKFPFAVAFVGLGVSMAGWLYNKIYP